MTAELNEKLFWLINAPAGKLIDALMTGFTITGYTIPSFLIGIAAMHFYKGLNRKNALLLAATFLLGGAVVQGIKYNLPTERPLKYYEEKSPPVGKKVHAPFTRLYSGTFPSGHSQTAFGAAAFLALLFRRHAALYFLWATMVALSRVYLGLHFPADVIVGAAIGTLAAILTIAVSRNR